MTQGAGHWEKWEGIFARQSKRAATCTAINSDSRKAIAPLLWRFASLILLPSLGVWALGHALSAQAAPNEQASPGKLHPLQLSNNQNLPFSLQKSSPIPLAQTPLPTQPLNPVPFPRDTQPPSTTPLPDLAPDDPLPPAEELLRPVAPSPEPVEPDAPLDGDSVTLFVEGFRVVGSTVFSEAEFNEVLAPFTNRTLTITDLFAARSAVTQLYLDAGYITSGAYLPPQAPENGIVTIQVLEGAVSEIQVNGTRRLNDSYVRSRLALAAREPLNVNRLVDGLRLLQLDPLITSISSELSTGLESGTSILAVTVTEADSFDANVFTDNDRSPTVGSWRRGLDVTQANLLGFGDRLQVGYINTDGSNEVNTRYTVPINPRNGVLDFSFGFTDSEVLEDPFNELDINSETRYYELTYRQPVVQTPTEELALSLTASRQESRSVFLEDELGEAIGFPSLGADEEGRTRISALRLAQEWTRQGNQTVLALRSQFSIGLDVFDPTINENQPDSRFVSWQGQGQWVQLLAEDTLLLVRGEAQLTGDELVPLEQFGLGGRRTVRGYRQDVLLTDNGVLATAEIRLPVARDRSTNGLLQFIPFLDAGVGWNVSRDTADSNVLLGAGLGLQWQQGDRFTARLDWGLPLVDLDIDEGNSLQASGVYFSIRYRAF
jgi:hemolysin activation/secretion protein